MTASAQVELDSSMAFARAFMEQGEWSSAKDALIKCLPLSRSLHGNNAATTMAICEKVGVCLSRMNLFVEAISYLRPAYEYHIGRTYKTPEPVLFVARSLGFALVGAGRHEEAIPIMYYAIETSQALHGPKAPGLWFLRSKLSISLRSTRKWQDLIALHQTVSDQTGTVTGGRTQQAVQIMLRNVSFAHAKVGAHDVALQLIFQALILGKNRTGLRDVDSIDDLCHCANILQKLKRHEEAEAALQKALELTQPVFGPNDGYRNKIAGKIRALHEDIERARKHEELLAHHAAQKASRLAAEAATAISENASPSTHDHSGPILGDALGPRDSHQVFVPLDAAEAIAPTE
jgi:tetratricopeptide (TPR) repeat protein